LVGGDGGEERLFPRQGGSGEEEEGKKWEASTSAAR
jgi:transketolase N-terminal domain/subunit